MLKKKITSGSELIEKSHLKHHEKILKKLSLEKKTLSELKYQLSARNTQSIEKINENSKI